MDWSFLNAWLVYDQNHRSFLLHTVAELLYNFKYKSCSLKSKKLNLSRQLLNYFLWRFSWPMGIYSYTIFVQPFIHYAWNSFLRNVILLAVHWWCFSWQKTVLYRKPLSFCLYLFVRFDCYGCWYPTFFSLILYFWRFYNSLSLISLSLSWNVSFLSPWFLRIKIERWYVWKLKDWTPLKTKAFHFTQQTFIKPLTSKSDRKNTLKKVSGSD